MKLRILLPVAAVAVTAAVAIPGPANADSTGMCPDHFQPTLVLVQPGADGKDRNNNLIVCHKDVPGQGDPTKDDRGVIISQLPDQDPANYDDDAGLSGDLLGL
jgi:hypothetical protein